MKNIWLKMNALYQQLSARERKLLFVLIGFVLCGSGLIAGGSLWKELSDRMGRNDELKKTIQLIKQKESAYLKNREQLEQLEAKLTAAPLQLNGQIEVLTKKYNIDPSPESTPLSPTMIGKKYRAQSVSILFPKIDLASLLPLMQELEETPGHLVQITQISIAPRDGKLQDFRADITVTTYERAPITKDSDEKNKTSGSTKPDDSVKEKP